MIKRHVSCVGYSDCLLLVICTIKGSHHEHVHMCMCKIILKQWSMFLGYVLRQVVCEVIISENKATGVFHNYYAVSSALKHDNTDHI